MAWYLYTGRLTKSIQNGLGNSTAVQPHTKVEILKITPTTRKMIARNVLHRTGKPVGNVPKAKSVESPDKKLMKSKLARFVAEKGKTGNRDVPPRSQSGAEKTEGEVAVEKNVETENAASVEVAPDTGENTENTPREKKKKKRG